MATASSGEPMLTACCVCGVEHNDMNVLHCGHLVCKICHQVSLSSRTQSSCTMCGHVITVSELQSLDRLSSNLDRDNVVLEVATDCLREHNSVVCRKCANIPASGVCSECKTMCRICYDSHNYKNHNVLQIPNHILNILPSSDMTFGGDDFDTATSRNTDIKDRTRKEAMKCVSQIVGIKKRIWDINDECRKLNNSLRVLSTYTLHMANIDSGYVTVDTEFLNFIQRIQAVCQSPAPVSLNPVVSMEADHREATTPPTVTILKARDMEICDEIIEIVVSGNTNTNGDFPAAREQGEETRVKEVDTCKQIHVKKAKNVTFTARKTKYITSDGNRVVTEIIKEKEILQNDKNALLAKIEYLERKSDEDKAMREAENEALKTAHKEHILEEQNKVRNFVMQIEKYQQFQQQVQEQCTQGRLLDVAMQMLKVFNVRLLGITCGLSFLMNVPRENWLEIVEHQVQMQAALAEILPENMREQVSWENVSDMPPINGDVDLHLGQPVPFATLDTQVEEDSQEWIESSSIPSPSGRLSLSQCLFSSTMASNSTDQSPLIRSIATTSSGYMLMADYNNCKILSFSLTQRTLVLSLGLPAVPLVLTMVSNNEAAVVAMERKLFLIHVSDDGEMVITFQTKTSRQYRGIEKGGNSDNLVLSCDLDDEGEARVDVFTRNGYLLRTIVTSRVVPTLSKPRYLCVVNDDLLVSEWENNSILRLELSTGRLLDNLRHPYLKHPYQISRDINTGNMFVASCGGSCIAVMSGSYEWRWMLTCRRNLELFDSPMAVCVSGQILLVSLYDYTSGSTIVKGYKLKYVV